MKTTVYTQDDSLVRSPACWVLLRSVAEGKPQWIQPPPQSADTDHRAQLRVEDLNRESGLDPYSRQDLLEIVCAEGYIDAQLIRDGAAALSLKLNARDRFE